MKRFVTVIGLAGLLSCLAAPSPMRAWDSNAEVGAADVLRPDTKARAGRLTIEVLEITDLSPVVGVRVELVQRGRTVLTDANGRATFVLGAGEYDVRVHDLTGPGPAIRIDELHARVGGGETVLLQVLDCGACL